MPARIPAYQFGRYPQLTDAQAGALAGLQALALAGGWASKQRLFTLTRQPSQEASQAVEELCEMGLCDRIGRARGRRRGRAAYVISELGVNTLAVRAAQAAGQPDAPRFRLAPEKRLARVLAAPVRCGEPEPHSPLFSPWMAEGMPASAGHKAISQARTPGESAREIEAEIQRLGGYAGEDPPSRLAGPS